jgi:hypothetical protein
VTLTAPGRPRLLLAIAQAARLPAARHRSAVPARGTVEVRLSGVREDVDTLVSLLGRMAAGLPVTTVGIELLRRDGGQPGRGDPGERAHLTVRVHPLGREARP